MLQQCEQIPSFAPDYGVVKTKPYIFHSSVFAYYNVLKCRISIFSNTSVYLRLLWLNDLHSNTTGTIACFAKVEFEMWLSAFWRIFWDKQALQDCFDKMSSKIKNQDCIPAHSKEILYEKESYTFCGSIHLVMMMNLIHDLKYGLTRLKKSYRFYYV